MKRLLLSFAALAASTTSAAPARGQHFTIDQVLSAPFASNLVAAHRGNAVAWLVNEHGARNVWVASGPAWQGRQVTV